jgi:plasmid stabilization system protein ParE
MPSENKPMQNVLFLTEIANKEFEAAAKWYEEQCEGLGNRFILVAKAKLLLIKAHPKRYPKRYLDFRETILHIFPYSIVYTYYEETKEIHVSAIYHCSRNPERKFRQIH